MYAINTKSLEAWFGNRVITRLLVWFALSVVFSVIFFRNFWASLPVMLSPDWIFRQYHASPWGVLALCLTFLCLKRKAMWGQMRVGTNLIYILLGVSLVTGAVLSPFSSDFMVFQVLLVSLGLFTIIFGSASQTAAIYLAIYGGAIFFPVLIEKIAENPYAQTAIIPLTWLLGFLGYPLENLGQWVHFVSRGGEDISVTITTGCAGPATMGVFLALFALMMLDMPLPPKKAVSLFLFGVVGTWFQSFSRLVLLLLVGYYLGRNTLWTVHLWTTYIVFPLWYLVFAYVYFKQVKRSHGLRKRQEPESISAVYE